MQDHPIPLFSLNQLKPNSGSLSYCIGRKVDLSHYQNTFPEPHSPPSLMVIQKSPSLSPNSSGSTCEIFGPCYHCWHAHCSSQSARTFAKGWIINTLTFQTIQLLLQLLSSAAVLQNQPQAVQMCGHGCASVNFYLHKTGSKPEFAGSGFKPTQDLWIPGFLWFCPRQGHGNLCQSWNPIPLGFRIPKQIVYPWDVASEQAGSTNCMGFSRNREPLGYVEIYGKRFIMWNRLT